MVKATDLVKQQQSKKNKKYIIFDKIYANIENKITFSSNINLYSTYYQIPYFLIGYPTYSIGECYLYIDKKLKENGFKTELYIDNIILINWKPIK